MNAQNSQVVSAYYYLRKGELDKAKIAIDIAVVHPKTSGKAKTWLYYGNVYLQIAASTTSENYKNLDPDALNKAYEGYLKALELDVKEEYKDQVDRNILICAEQFYTKGVNLYNEQDFENSMKAFGQSSVIYESAGKIDSLATYNAALTAEYAGFNEDARKYYSKLIEIHCLKPGIYSSLADLEKADGDTIAAMTYIKQGREDFPDDFNLIIAETNIYLATGEQEKAMELLQLGITKDDTNPTLFFAVGTQYVNRAIEILTEADALPLNEEEKYNQLMEEANGLFEKSLPYLEKANELQPDDPYTLRILKDIFARLGMHEK